MNLIVVSLLYPPRLYKVWKMLWYVIGICCKHLIRIMVSLAATGVIHKLVHPLQLFNYWVLKQDRSVWRIQSHLKVCNAGTPPLGSPGVWTSCWINFLTRQLLDSCAINASFLTSAAVRDLMQHPCSCLLCVAAYIIVCKCCCLLLFLMNCWAETLAFPV